MSNDDKKAARMTRRRQELGEDARCICCGCTDIMALEQRAEGILCYECARGQEGRPTSEYHHLLGRQLDASLAIHLPGNLHRLLDDAKRDWELELRRLRAHHPLLRSMAALYAIRDFHRATEVELDRILEHLFALHTRLTDRLGPNYAEELGLPSLWPETGL